MLRSLYARIKDDLQHKLVILTGPRQVGKTTLAKALMADFAAAQYLNWDVPADRRVILAQSWPSRAGLVVFDEIHKMPDWKAFLKGAWDGRRAGQAMLVTGSARMETFRQAGASLAGRYFALRLHPLSVSELVEQAGMTAEDALHRLIERGGFPEPFLAERAEDAERWRNQYATDLVREDVLEFGRVHEINAMRLLLELLRERVGSPIRPAALARELQLAPTTVSRYLEILEALYVVFPVRPFHRNIARAILKEPKLYFYDTGLVRGDAGVRFENACAALLQRHAHLRYDGQGQAVGLHYIRDKQQHEVDFVLTREGEPTHCIECKLADAPTSRYFHQIAQAFPAAEAVQISLDLRREEQRGRVSVVRAAEWLAGLG